jgi:hypothetical protein
LNNLVDWEACGGWINEVRIGLVGDCGAVFGGPLAIFNLENMIQCRNNYESSSNVDTISFIFRKTVRLKIRSVIFMNKERAETKSFAYVIFL